MLYTFYFVTKPYALEERTFNFAKDVLGLCRVVPKTITNVEIVRQLARSAGSVGANYIEASQAVSKKDFFLRLKICRKEAKESCYWLRLMDVRAEGTATQRDLIAEADELTKIFGAMTKGK